MSTGEFWEPITRVQCLEGVLLLPFILNCNISRVRKGTVNVGGHLSKLEVQRNFEETPLRICGVKKFLERSETSCSTETWACPKGAMLGFSGDC